MSGVCVHAFIFEMLSVYVISCFKLLMASYSTCHTLNILSYSLQGQIGSSCQLPTASQRTSLCSRLPPAVPASPVWWTHHTDPALRGPSAGQLWLQTPRLPPLHHPASHPRTAHPKSPPSASPHHPWPRHLHLPSPFSLLSEIILFVSLFTRLPPVTPRTQAHEIGDSDLLTVAPLVLRTLLGTKQGLEQGADRSTWSTVNCWGHDNPPSLKKVNTFFSRLSSQGRSKVTRFGNISFRKCFQIFITYEGKFINQEYDCWYVFIYSTKT